MKKIYLVCLDSVYYQNRIFDLTGSGNRDNCYYPHYLLKKELKKHGVELNTYDYLKDGENDYILLFLDIPKEVERIVKRHPLAEKVLFLFEAPPVYPMNWDKKYHQYFSKIFTWNDDWIDNKKYFKLCWPIPIDGPCDVSLAEKTKFCTLIAGNKMIKDPLELYSERLKTIRWFENNHPEDFDLYGMGWDRRFFASPFSALNRITPLTKLLKPDFPSYRGTISTKKEVLRQYKFSICYENMWGLPGYMTEKIFDSFVAGCVPVYWGPPNIEKYVSIETFIDRRKFASLEDLYAFMKNMPDAEYQRYLDAIRNYLLGDQVKLFSAEHYAKHMGEALLRSAAS